MSFKHNYLFLTTIDFGFGYCFVIFLGGKFSYIRLFLIKSFGNEQYIYPSDSYRHLYDETLNQTSAARPIALAHVQSSDHLVFLVILLLYLTTFAFIAQQSYIVVRYITRFNAFSSHNGRSCKFRTSNFSYSISFNWQQVMNLIYFFRLHVYFVASARERGFSKHLRLL